MITGFCGIEYSTNEIKNGRFVDRTLESDFLQTRYDILRQPGRKMMVDESTWIRNGEEARKQFLKMMEASNKRNEIKFFESDYDGETHSTVFTYDGQNEVPKDITTILIGDNASEIKDGAFKDCKELESFVMNEGLLRIGKNAFENCQKLMNVRLLDVDYVGDEAFLNCSGLVSIELGSNMQHIGMGALKNCSSLVSITLPPNVTFIGDYAFANCSSLKNANIMDGITKIPSYCFQNCTSLEQVILPSSIESVGDGAFENCPNLELYVPTLIMKEAEELLGVKMVAKAENDDLLFKCDKGYVVRLYKDLYLI